MAYRSRTNQPRKKGIPMLAVVLVALLLVAGGIGFYVLSNFDAPALSPSESAGGANPTASNALSTDKGTFYDGVFVDGIALGGLTMDQARAKVEEQQKPLIDTIKLNLTDAKGNLSITNVDVTYSFDTDTVLQQAFEQGRTGTEEEKKAAIDQLPANPVKLTTKMTVDPAAVEQKVRDYAATLTTPGVDAAFKGIDPDTHQPQFTPDTPGTQVNPDTLWEQVKTAFDANSFGDVAVQDEPLDAAVTLAALQADLQLVTGPAITMPGFSASWVKRVNDNNGGHTFTTYIKNDAASRRKNIELGNGAISGTMLMPGETLSVNDKTGPRTAAKGYQKAPVDVNGIDDIGLGGGMCQVSGTLYNAVIAAGPSRIEIVEREHHSIPSAYLAKGTDATVDYGSKDFQFKNISNKPILVVMFYDKGTDGKYYEHTDIYCAPDPEGAMYYLKGKVVSNLAAKVNDPVKKVPNNKMDPGQTELVAAHGGSIVDRYLVKVAKDGTSTETKLSDRDTYPATGPSLIYCPKDPKPTDTPSATPTPSVTPTAPTATPPASEPTISTSTEATTPAT